MGADQLSRQVWDALSCPHCGQPLSKSNSGADCTSCGSSYVYSEWGSLDLRCIRPKTQVLEFNLGSSSPLELDLPGRPLTLHPNPEVDFSGVSIPHHLSKELMSYFPRAQSRESLMLDLGSGGGKHREVCEHAGFEYVSLDYSSSAA